VASTETARHDALVKDLQSRFAKGVLDVDRSFDDLVVVVDRADARDVLVYLRREKGFDLLSDIAGVDCLNLDERRERFELEYILYAVAADTRMRVRVPVPEGDLDVPSVADVWQSANWGEREAYEMFGFNFVGHPCLKRLLTHHEFKGHPLRKDYPVMKGQWCSTTSDLTEEMNE
jgi:NADH/F420H2 dehydrogenase subunit C